MTPLGKVWGGTIKHIGDCPSFLHFSPLFVLAGSPIYTVLLSNMSVLSFMLMLSFMHNALSLFHVNVFGFGIIHLLLRFSSPVPCRILGK